MSGPTSQPTSDVGRDAGFGGFELGGMELALPMAALREVLPFHEARPLPSPARCVVGGIEVRGVVIPVVDLRVVLGRETPDIDMPCVLVMIHEGKVLGLLAETVTGIFAGEEGSTHRVSVHDSTAALFHGGVRRKDNQALVSVLAPPALSRLHQVPMVDDPEPARRMDATADEDVVIDDRAVPMMLVRCAHVPLAIEAMAVHATISNPEVQPSVLAMGECMGVIAYAGMKVPAMDLLAICGLGRLASTAGMQAFILLMPQGYVAFLVDEVLDVVRTQADELIRVPPFALPAAGLFAGAIAAAALPQELTQRQGMQANQFLVIDAQALKGREDVAALARTNTPMVQVSATTSSGVTAATKRSADMPAATAAGKPLRDMVTYELNQEAATPLSQIVEILPHTQDVAAFQGEGAMLGLLVNRGRSIPVYSLCRLTGAVPPGLSSETSVLIVELDGERIGFSVPRLRSIEPASWEPELAHSAVLSPGGRPAQKLACVGSGVDGPGRMLPMIDLHALARALQSAHALA